MMDDIYSNLDNYNEEATIEELRNENKELKLQLEDLNGRLENLQKDFDKLCSEHKRLEFNYSSLLKTAKAEVERKTQAIALLNAEKDKLVLQTLQNRNTRNIPKYNEPWNQNWNDRRMSDTNHTNKQTMEVERGEYISFNKKVVEVERKETRISPNFEPHRKDSRISPNEDTVRPVIDSSAKENISQKRPNIDHKPSSRIRNRRKSMPAFENAKFSSDEEAFINAEDHYIPKEYPDRHFDRHCRPSMRTSDCSSLEERNSYEHPKDPKRRHRYEDSDKFRNNDRFESHRYKRDSPGRSRRRNRDAYEDKRSNYDRHRRLESPPNEKYSHYSLRQHPDYEKMHYNDRRSSRGSNERHPTKHKALEYDEPRSKKMKPNTYQRQYEDEKRNYEKHQIVDEYDKQFTSCQSPDINFIESSPSNHPVREIKLSATTKLDDPRKLSDRYVKDSRDKDTLLALHGINVDIPRIPLENTSYEIECVKMPEALKEKPATDDLLNQIYNLDDNFLVNASIESGEILFEPEDKVPPHDEKGQITSSKTSTQTDKIHKNPSLIPTYRIPKKSSVFNTHNSKNKDVNIDISVKDKDKSSDDTTEVRTRNTRSDVKTSFKEDLKKDNVLELKETPLVVDKPQLPPLNIDIELDKPLQLPTFNPSLKPTYRIPKKSSVSNTHNSKNKDVNIDISVKGKDKSSDDTTEVKTHNTRSDVKTSFKEDLKKDNVLELKETPLVVDKPQLPPLNIDIELDKPPQLPTFNPSLKPTCRIPKKSSVFNTHNSKNKDVNIDISVQGKDKSSDNTTEVRTRDTRSDVKTSFKEDLKKDNVLELKETPLVVDKPQLPPLNIDIELDKPPQLPTFNINIETKDEHEKKKESKKIVEDDLLLSDETSDCTEIRKSKESAPTENKTASKNPSPNVVQTNEIHSKVDTSKEKSPHDKKIKTKKKHSKHKSTQERTKPVKKIEKPTKKVKEKHEVKSKEVKNHKFSELFGDSNSLILPEDLGLPTVAVPSQLGEFPIFEDAQDAIDVNSKIETVTELPKLNDIIMPKLPVEIEINTKVLKLPKLNEIEANKSVEKDETKTSKTNTQTDITNKETETSVEIPIQSLYQNLEVCVKPKEDSVKTVIISSGVQPDVAINEHKPLVKEHKPNKIDLKALATSTPYKLDTIATHIDVNPKVTEINGHSTEVDNLNTTDTSLSNVDVKSNDNLPDLRIVVKRRRRVMKKP